MSVCIALMFPWPRQSLTSQGLLHHCSTPVKGVHLQVQRLPGNLFTWKPECLAGVIFPPAELTHSTCGCKKSFRRA